MIVKILGLIDIFTGIFFALSAFFDLFSGAALAFSLILLAKAAFFVISLDFASITDIIVALIIFASFMLTLPYVLIMAITLYLLAKGVFSLL